MYIDEWRRRYGEPTREEVRDARTTTPEEDRAIRNGQLPAWSQPSQINPAARPRLVLSNNPRARRRPVLGGRIPKRSRARTRERLYDFERVHFHPAPGADGMSEVSYEVDDEEEREVEYFDDGQHHNRDQPHRRDDYFGGGGDGGGLCP